MKGEVSFLSGVSVTTLWSFPQEDYFSMVVVIFRAGPAAKCLIKSLPTLLKSGVSGARIDFLPPGSKGNDGSDCPLGGRNGRWFFFFFLLLLSWSLQKEGYKHQTILPHLVARHCLGKKEILPATLSADFYNLLGLKNLQWNTCNMALCCAEVERLTPLKLEDEGPSHTSCLALFNFLLSVIF